MMSSGISGTGISVVSPVAGFRTSNARFIATFQMQRSSKARRIVSMLSGTPLWSRIQTRTGASVPTRATARSRNTWLLSPGADSPSWLDSISPIASGVADGEGVEGVRVLDAGRHHEVEAENVVLAAEATGERQNLVVELVVRLAVHQHEPGGVGQRVRQERQQRGRF